MSAPHVNTLLDADAPPSRAARSPVTLEEVDDSDAPPRIPPTSAAPVPMMHSFHNASVPLSGPNITPSSPWGSYHNASYPASLSQPSHSPAREYSSQPQCGESSRSHGHQDSRTPNTAPRYLDLGPLAHSSASGPRSAPSAAEIHQHNIPGTSSVPSGSEHVQLLRESVPVVHISMTYDVDNSVSFQDLPFHFLDRNGLVIALASHCISRSRDKRKADDLLELALNHRCPLTPNSCANRRFKLSHDWKDSPDGIAEDNARQRLAELLQSRVGDSFPHRISKPKRTAIIQKWIDNFSTKSMEQVTCAVCAEKLLRSQTDPCTLSDAQLSLLSSDHLPLPLRPPPHELFGNALLESAGFAPTDDNPRQMNVCKSCQDDLTQGRLPRLALANGTYTAWDRVPSDIRELFDKATAVELSLIARYRVKCTIHKFSAKTGRSDPLSQRYMQGNTITFANDCNGLLNVLPPSKEEVGDTICVMFVGSVFPSPDELKKFTPILARRHVVFSLLTWLKQNNPFYKDVEISVPNLDALLPNAEPAVPSGISTRLLSSAVRESEAATYVPDSQSPEDPLSDDAPVPTATTGIIGQSIEGMSVREIKLLAIQHWKSGGGAYTVPHGTQPINEYDNTSLFPCMFPHLFPFGIGGLEDRSRRVRLSMQAHIKHLLNLADTRFQTDNSFAFVAMNILQRRRNSKASRFKISRRNMLRASELLSSVEASTCANIIERGKGSGYVAPLDDKEKEAFELLDKVNLLSSDVPGSSASKVKLRNKIRSLMHWAGMPTFFITINPADVYSPLFCHFAGVNVDLDSCEPSLPSDYERRLYLARNPAAGARFFHAIMRAFFDVIIDHKSEDGGLFGKVDAYFGTIEAQGRGSLHCHMLIWVNGSPGPERLRQKMRDDEKYKADVLRYLEDMIHTHIPGNTDVVPLDEADAPERPLDEPHPCTLRCPRPPIATGDNDDSKLDEGPRTPTAPGDNDDFEFDDAPRPSTASGENNDSEFDEEWARQLLRLVIDCNYHVHSDTCWKYLKEGEPKDHEHCRMRIDGMTRGMSMIDPETGSILLRRFHPFINNYNELIIMLVRCNMDIKFIGSGAGAKALIYYVTDYITKASLPTHVAFSALLSVLEVMKDPASGIASEMSGDVDAEKRGRLLLVKAVNSLLSNQELSGQQVMMNLLGLADGEGDHYTSHTFRILYWAAAMAFVKREEVQEAEVLNDKAKATPDPNALSHPIIVDVNTQSDDKEDDAVSDTHSLIDAELDDSTQQTTEEPDNVIIDLSPGDGEESSDVIPLSQLSDYRLRGEIFRSLSLYWFAAATEKITSVSEQIRIRKRKQPENDDTAASAPPGRKAAPRGRFLAGHPQRLSHLMRMRSSTIVPILIGPTLPRRGEGELTETYARAMLVLFKPWRSFADLRPPGLSWVDAFQAYNFDEKSVRIMGNMNMLHECKDARDDYNEKRRLGKIKTHLIDDEMVHARAATGEAEESMVNVVEDLAPHLIHTTVTDDERLELRGLSAFADPKGLAVAQLLVMQAQSSGLLKATAADPENPPTDGATAMSAEEEVLLQRRKAELRSIRTEIATARFVVEDDPLLVGSDEQMTAAPLPSYITNASTPVSLPQLATFANIGGATAPTMSKAEHVEAISTEYGLNAKQTEALSTVAHRLEDLNDSQMIMFISGPGGTGKTLVIDAITQLFRRLGKSQRLRKAAPTGVAARLIGGSTIHSLLSLGRNKISSATLQNMQSLWKDATHLCLDEASMYGARLLSQISSRLSQLRNSSLPFGGLNIIFSGDICQLPPVGDKLLWDRPETTISPEQAALMAPKGKEQQVTHGRGLWLHINEVVLLTVNYRARRDPNYVDLTNHVRTGHGRQGDYENLKSRLMTTLSSEEVARFGDAPLVTADKLVRDLWNRNAVKAFAGKTNQTVYDYCATDVMNGEEVSGTLKETLLDLPASTVHSDSLGRLPLVKGMKVMLLQNVLTELGVVNGADGVLEDVLFETVDGNRVATAAYVRFPGSGIQMEDLPQDVVLILPQNESISVHTKTLKRLSFTRNQLPILPAYAMTDYKSQGQSFELVILDLASSGRRLESAYVMVSRATSLGNVLLLRDFDVNRIYRRQNECTYRELKRLEKLDQETHARFVARR